MRGENCLVSLNSKIKMISARNKMKGEVINVNKGAVNGIVKVKFGSNTVSATISLEAIKELGITEGKQVTAIAKATDVMVGVGEIKGISARNIFKGELNSKHKSGRHIVFSNYFKGSCRRVKTGRRKRSFSHYKGNICNDNGLMKLIKNHVN